MIYEQIRTFTSEGVPEIKVHVYCFCKKKTISITFYKKKKGNTIVTPTIGLWSSRNEPYFVQGTCVSG